jgi:hypothetical protein
VLVALLGISGLTARPLSAQAKPAATPPAKDSNAAPAKLLDADKPILTIFGTAALKNVVADTSGATSATGSIGVMYESYHVMTTGLISVAGKVDTAHAQFGGTLLPTSTGGTLNAGSLELRVHRILTLQGCRPHKAIDSDEDPLCGVGFRILGSASSAIWDADPSPKQNNPRPATVPVWGTQWNLSYTFVDDSVDASRVWMIFDIGLATRHMRGDLTLPTPSIRARRDSLLGTTQTDFYGPMAQLTIRYGDIYAGLGYYYFGGSVPGLSHGQVVAGIALQANLLAKTLGDTRKAKSDSVTQAAAKQKAQTDSIKKWAVDSARARDSVSNKVKADTLQPAKNDSTKQADSASKKSPARAPKNSAFERVRPADSRAPSWAYSKSLTSRDPAMLLRLQTRRANDDTERPIAAEEYRRRRRAWRRAPRCRDDRRNDRPPVVARSRCGGISVHILPSGTDRRADATPEAGVYDGPERRAAGSLRRTIPPHA